MMRVGLEISNTLVRPRSRNLLARNLNTTTWTPSADEATSPARIPIPLPTSSTRLLATNLKEFMNARFVSRFEKLEPLLLTGIRTMDIAAH
jgi:hypothetical protein